MDYETQCLIDHQHPSLPGHFPGNPVVPGVVILDEVLHALTQWQKNVKVAGFNTVKFIQPLLPGETFTISLEQTKPQRVKFQCMKAQTICASGIINIESE